MKYIRAIDSFGRRGRLPFQFVKGLNYMPLSRPLNLPLPISPSSPTDLSPPFVGLLLVLDLFALSQPGMSCPSKMSSCRHHLLVHGEVGAAVRRDIRS